MELFGKTRLKIGNSILKKKLAKNSRKVSFSNLSNVRSIGVVWDASKTHDFSCLSRFFQKMHDRNIDVKILGYYKGKELPDQYTAIRYLTCIRNNDIDLFYIPDSADTESFIKTRFDVLIDINFDKLLPLKYISSLSRSGFKVGLFDSEPTEQNFDLMLELKKPVMLDNYLDEIIHYLELINSGSSDQKVK
ncbi:MAG: hypothetical protein ABSG89_09275 [Bacteroidales bacterium]|jgi:hypothetical protein